MKITLLSEESIRFEPLPGPLTVESPSDEHSFSPFHMMGSALAVCTYSVMHAWAEQAKLDATDITIDVSWTWAEDPHRVGAYELRFRWPSLPENRIGAAHRVAQACAVHATLSHPPAISIAHIA